MAKRVPFILGHELSDCGAACLTMALAYHGRRERVADVREITGTSKDGVTARGLVDAARHYGLEAQGVRLDVDAVARLAPGTILHWGTRHFVVLSRHLRRGRIEIIDPSVGPSRIDPATLAKLFTGVAIVTKPGDRFVRTSALAASPFAFLRRLLLTDRTSLRRVAASSLFLRLLAVAVPALTGVLIDRILPAGDRHLLAVVSICSALIAVQVLALSVLRAQLFLRLRTTLDMRMTLDFVRHLLALPFDFFLRRSGGDLIARVRSHAVVRDMITAGAVSAVIDGALAVGYLFVLAAASPILALTTAAAGAVEVAILMGTYRLSRYLMAEQLQAESRSQSYLYQLLRGVETVKTSGAEARVVDHFASRYIDELNVSYRRARLGGLVEAAISTVRLAAPLAVLLVGGVQVIDNRLTAGGMLALSALAIGFLEPLAALVTTAMRLQPVTSYLERIQDVMEARSEEDGDLREAPPLSGAITLESVVFRYNPLGPPVIDGVSVAIEPGTTIALVGRSGSGKSTLGRLLVGLYPPESGRVLHDGLDLATLSPRSARRQFGVVTQDPYLFGLSIRENVALRSPDAPLNEIASAARTACVHDDIMALPLGYDTVLTDAGASLSGGQRQRLALARALLDGPRVLLLDEATSSLDTVTEAAVHRNLAALDATVIIIAHRLSTITAADQVLVIDGGRVVEHGTHGSLAAANGHYAALIRAQTSEALPRRRARPLRAEPRVDGR
jgi:ATP-binding cassette subfamily B protein